MFLLIAGLIGLAIFAVFFGDALYTAPSCSDGTRNQSEAGIDCGGPCAVLCEAQVQDLSTLWSRSFPGAQGAYDVVALIENTNTAAGVEDVAYSFKLYDVENILIAEREGRTFVNPHEVFAIYERSVATGDRVPTRTFLTLTRLSPWTTEVPPKPDLRITDRQFDMNSGSPRLRAVIVNASIFEVEDVVITAIIYDESGNAAAVSKTEVPRLRKDERKDIAFIFPRTLPTTPARIDMLARVKAIGS